MLNEYHVKLLVSSVANSQVWLLWLILRFDQAPFFKSALFENKSQKITSQPERYP